MYISFLNQERWKIFHWDLTVCIICVWLTNWKGFLERVLLVCDESCLLWWAVNRKGVKCCKYSCTLYLLLNIFHRQIWLLYVIMEMKASNNKDYKWKVLGWLQKSSFLQLDYKMWSTRVRWCRNVKTIFKL